MLTDCREGICHVYVDEHADAEVAVRVAGDCFAADAATTMLLLMTMVMLLYPLPINRSRFEDQLALRLQCRRDAAPARGYPIAR